MSKSITIARSEAEREEVYRFRYETLVQELGWFRDSADHQRRTLRDAHDPGACLLVLRAADGGLAGTMRINFGADAPFDREFLETYQPERFLDVVPFEGMSVCTRFMVRKELRGTPASFELIAECVRIQAERRVELLFCDCHPHFLKLYTGLGFRSCRSSYNDPQLGIQVPLALITGDDDHQASAAR